MLRSGDKVRVEGFQMDYIITRVSPDGNEVDVSLGINFNFEMYRIPSHRITVLGDLPPKKAVQRSAHQPGPHPLQG